ncbi:unnamed protein product [Lactuca saligna]|uniref:Uncharacterized protein n=1 Tax=Lactuca saligna TaxID=75948 RepID=A0AA35Y736_LACSI|nr:unnamed protein product [Lactuca saligna]
MADSLLSSIATFHTTKIIVNDSSKFPFIGSIPETMYRCVFAASILIMEYKKLPFFGPRELTPEMQRFLDEADKLKKGGKKGIKKKEVHESPSFKLITPKKRKGKNVEPLAPNKRMLKEKVHK